jgi:hypothetical protein
VADLKVLNTGSVDIKVGQFCDIPAEVRRFDLRLELFNNGQEKLNFEARFLIRILVSRNDEQLE